MTAALDASAAGMARPAVTMPRVLLVLGGFTALTILFFWPWISHLSSALIGPPEDNMQDFWNSWHAANAHGWHDFLFTDQIRYPQGTSLSYHSFAWPQVFAVAVLSHIFGADFSTLVALHNLTLLASFPLAATAMFFLARHLLGEGEGRDAGAVLAGFIFAFNPWHVAQTMHHAHVSGIEFLPLFVLFYLKGLEQRSTRLLAAASAMAALSALSCWYFLFYLSYFIAFQLLTARIRDGRWSTGWALTAPALCLGATVLLLSPWLVHMIGAPAADLSRQQHLCGRPAGHGRLSADPSSGPLWRRRLCGADRQPVGKHHLSGAGQSCGAGLGADPQRRQAAAPLCAGRNGLLRRDCCRRAAAYRRTYHPAAAARRGSGQPAVFRQCPHACPRHGDGLSFPQPWSGAGLCDGADPPQSNGARRNGIDGRAHGAGFHPRLSRRDTHGLPGGAECHCRRSGPCSACWICRAAMSRAMRP